MKKRVKIEKSSGNVFADLGLPDSDELMLKAHLVMFIARVIEREGLTQAQTAALIGLRQPDVSKLLRGRFEGFSLERLLSFVRMLGTDVEIKFKPSKPKQEGRILMIA